MVNLPFPWKKKEQLGAASPQKEHFGSHFGGDTSGSSFIRTCLWAVCLAVWAGLTIVGGQFLFRMSKPEVGGVHLGYSSSH